jgi:[ribosomal protein S5]-alanine N-acetyltransferase
MENKIYLRAFEYSDLSFLNSIRNDDILFQTTTGNKYYVSSEYDKKWVEDKIFNNYHQLYLVICCKNSNEPVGYTSANNIDYINRKAEWGGMLISSKHINGGFGTEACHLFIDHLFGELGMNMIYAFVKENNKASNRLSEKFGFTKDGVIRDFVYKQNSYHNVSIYTLLKSEYDNRK